MLVAPTRKEVRSWVKSSPRFVDLHEQYIALVACLVCEPFLRFWLQTVFGGVILPPVSLGGSL